MTGREHAAIGVGLALPVGVALVVGPTPVLRPPPGWLVTAIGWLPTTGGLVSALIILFLFVGGGLIGALLPDLDGDRSLLEAAPWHSLRRLSRRRSPLLLILLAPFLITFGLLLWLINLVLMAVTSHRSATHSLTALLLVGVGCWLGTAWFAGEALALGLVVGYASHLWADGLTPLGVELAAPWSRRHFHFLPRLLRFRGGSPSAHLLASGIMVAGTLAALWRAWLPVR